MSGVVNGVNKTSDEGEEEMKNLMILTLLLFVAVGCKSDEPVEIAPTEEVPAVEVLKEEVTE